MGPHSHNPHLEQRLEECLVLLAGLVPHHIAVDNGLSKVLKLLVGLGQEQIQVDLIPCIPKQLLGCLIISLLNKPARMRALCTAWEGARVTRGINCQHKPLLAQLLCSGVIQRCVHRDSRLGVGLLDLLFRL